VQKLGSMGGIVTVAKLGPPIQIAVAVVAEMKKKNFLKDFYLKKNLLMLKLLLLNLTLKIDKKMPMYCVISQLDLYFLFSFFSLIDSI
jgi:hypothetical protein